MNYPTHFATLLQNSTDAFVWAAQQIPEDKLFSVSPRHPESWSVARNIHHVQFQEEKVVLPNMRLWLANRSEYAQQDNILIEHYGPFEVLVEDEETAWSTQCSIVEILTRFQAGRAAQIALLSQFPETAWSEEKKTVWGPATLRWTVTKTYQHTVEHINDMLKPALYWTGLRANI